LTSPIAIGVSSCLLGELVRYDGGHKLDTYIRDILGVSFRLVGVCPEKECGLPVPREKMRLEGDPASPHLITIFSRIDLTEQMLAYCRAKVVELESEELCGFIFKKNSPSSGLAGVKIFNNSVATDTGSGLFAAAVVRHFPHLPVVEDESLAIPAVLADFIEQILSYHRLKK